MNGISTTMRLFFLGVWSKRVIEKNKIYGPFVGEKKKLTSVSDHTYAWEVRQLF